MLLAVSVLSAAPAFSQAVFTVGVDSKTGADNGATELTGAIRLTVLYGTTVAAPMAVHYSSTITNNSALEITVRGSGALAVVDPNPVWDKTSNTIIFDIPAGGAAGDQLFIEGVRVTLLGNTENRVTADVTGLTANGNAITIGQSNVTVIERIIPPYVVDWMSSLPISWKNGQIQNAGTSIKVSESFVDAFTSTLGIYGQTTPTLIRIKPYPSLPPGVTLTYAAISTCIETTAFFTTLSGAPETVPRKDGSTDVVYRFTGAYDSPTTPESFPFSISANVTSPATSGTVSFQTEILPIGTYPPTSTNPSKAIPRYTERYVPDEAELLTGQTELAFPFRIKSAKAYTGLALTNLLNNRVNVTLAAYDTTGKIILGQNIDNPVTITLPRNGQFATLANEVFGPGFNLSTGGTIIAVGQTPIMTGFYLIGDENGSHLDGATADISPLGSWVFTNVARQNPSPYTSIELFNQDANPANVTLRLRDVNGQLLATATPTVAAGGTLYRSLTELFPTVALGSFSGGYIEGVSDVALVARETFGNALESNVLGGQASFQSKAFNVPHFATGGGNSTELSLIDLDLSRQANLTLTLFDDNGIAIPIAGNPVKVSIQPTKQLLANLDTLFPALSDALITGYIHVDVEPVLIGPYEAVPVLAGSVRFSAADGYSSAALPVRSLPNSNIVYSHIAQAAGFYTGVAVLNSNNGPAGITLDAFREDGSFVGTYSTSLFANGKMAKLLYQMIPATAGQAGGYVRVRSTVPITSFALFGTLDGLSLSAIPPQDGGDY